jgi:hypothetical protein
MAKDRNERYQTASEMALELARIAASVVEAPSPTIVDEVDRVQSDAVIPTAPPPSPIPLPILPPQSVAREPIHQPTPTPLSSGPCSARQSTSHPPAGGSRPTTDCLPTTPPVIPRSISRKPLSKPLISIVVVGVIGLLCLVVFGVFSLRGVRFMKNFLNFRASVLKSTPTQSIDSAVIAAPTVEDPPLPIPTLGAILFQDDFKIEQWPGELSIRWHCDYENGLIESCECP